MVKTGLAFLTVATPVGWMGLVVAGAAIAGIAATASMGMNSVAKAKGGGIYDTILRWINSR